LGARKSTRRPRARASSKETLGRHERCGSMLVGEVGVWHRHMTIRNPVHHANAGVRRDGIALTLASLVDDHGGEQILNAHVAVVQVPRDARGGAQGRGVTAGAVHHD